MYEETVEGERELTGGKYHWLWQNDVSTTEWATLKPQSPFYLFILQDTYLRAEYERGWIVTDMMPVNVLGFQSHRDYFALDFYESRIRSRIADLRDTACSDDEIRQKYGLQDNRDWHLSIARKELQRNESWNTVQFAVYIVPLTNDTATVVSALAETIRLMADTDEAIEDHGGWPIA